MWNLWAKGWNSKSLMHKVVEHEKKYWKIPTYENIFDGNANDQLEIAKILKQNMETRLPGAVPQPLF